MIALARRLVLNTFVKSAMRCKRGTGGHLEQGRRTAGSQRIVVHAGIQGDTLGRCDLQDVALGQMLETGKEAMKEDFIIICDNKENKS